MKRNFMQSKIVKQLSIVHCTLLIVFCLFFSATAWGQTTATFNDGTTTMSYVPFYGLYADYGAKGQFIIPATDLAEKGITSGCQISKLKFFSSATSTGTYFGSSVKVEVGEVANTTFSSNEFVTSGLNTVLSGTSLSRSSDGTMLVEFSSNYTYNGGNLLISIGGYGSGCPSTSWYGVSSTNAGVYGYNSSNNQTIPSSSRNTTSYAPKTEITYIPTTPYIALSPSSATVLTGFTQALTASYGNVSGTPTITYSSSNTNVATVSGSGTTATVTAVAPGSATITATMNGSYTATCAITVEDPSYCTPNPSSRDSKGITAVSFGSGSYVVSNSDETNGLPASSPFYADYTSMVGGYEPGETATVSISYTTGYNYGTIIWVDWNKDYTFDDSEIVFAGLSSTTSQPSGTHTLNATFSIPANQAADDYRMRIAGADSYFDSYIGGSASANHSPCFSSTWSVCHDYTLSVVSNTSCSPYAITYTYGFEDASDFNCWTKSNLETCSSNSNMGGGIYNSSSYAKTGSKLFIFSSYCGETEPQYLISPELSGVVNGVHVEFDYAIAEFAGAPETFQVGYSTTDNNISSFTWSNEITCTSSESDYEHFKANFMGNVKYIAVKYTSADSYYLLLDDFSISEAPSCLEPTNVTASNISTTGARINWTAGGSETTWDLFYTNNPSTVPGSGATPSVSGITSSSKPYNLSVLDPATTYYLYVRAACSGSDKSDWSSVCTFNTDCNAMSLPYTNDFETGALTVCWTAINESPVYMNTSVSDDSPNNGTYHLELDLRTPSGTQIIVLPEVDASYALTGYEVSFYAMLSNKGNGSFTAANRTLTIGVMTDPTDPSTFVQVGEIVSPTDTYAQYTVSLSGYSGNGHYIAIKHDETTSGNNGYTFIDDLKVSTPPPTKIVASSTHAADEMTWAEFVGYVNGGYSYSGKTVTLEENITGVTAMAGSYETGKPFSGTFEGNGHSIAVNINNSGNSNTGDAYKGAAPFRLISGATIQNLTVTGSVQSSAHHAAGLVGFCATGSTNIIVNCHVNTSVTNNTPGVGTGTNNYIGGIIGHNQDATTTIEGCVYDGTLTSTAFKGGMVGFSGNAAITISNSYFCGDYSTSANFSPVGCKAGNATVTYTVSNLYYSKDAGAFGDNSSYDATASGAMHAYSITPVSPVILTVNGNATDIYSVSGITAYTTGIKYNNVLYAGDGEDVELILSGSSIGEYAASNGTLSGTSNPYTLSMDASDTEISAYNCAKPTDLQAFLTPGNGTVATLAWTSNGSATNWVLEYSTTSDFSVIVDSENVSGSPSHRLEGLTAETTYYARVKADCGGTDGQSAWSSTCEFTPTDEPTLTVNNGSSTNGFVPIYGYYVDQKSYSQFIIPANDLSAMACGTINKLTFYSSTANVAWTDAKFEVYMMEVDYTAFPSTTLVDWTTMTKVMAEAHLSISDNIMEVTLSAPFDYSGGNLMIGFKQTVSGSYLACTWLGVTATGASLGGYNTSIGQKNFLPKITFDFTPTTTPAPINLNANNLGVTSVDLSWVEIGTATGWNVEYSTTSDFSSSVNSVNVSTTPTTSLTGLASETTYYFRVKANGGSCWSATSGFTTLSPCMVPNNLSATNILDEQADLNWSSVQQNYEIRYREVIAAAADDTYDFEDGTMQGWTSYDEDGDGYGWSHQTGNAHGGTHNVYARYNSSAVPKNWLISPQIPLGGTLSFWAKNSSSRTERFQVYVSTTGSDISNFTAIGDLENPASSYASSYEYDLSGYSGMGYVAIKHTAEVDQYWLYVDDITITRQGEYGSWITLNNVSPDYTLTGLDPNTDYEWQVRGLSCSGSTNTDWSESGFFTTLNKYTIVATANPVAGGTITGVGEYAEGQVVTLEASNNTGYSFTNWTEGGSIVLGAEAEYTFLATSDRTLVANFEPNTYLVTLHTNNGTINAGDVTSYTYGVGATLPSDVTKTGYTFAGWYDNSGLGGSAVTAISTTDFGDKEYWAKWTANTYAITLDKNGGSTNGSATATYGSAELTSISAPVRTGYSVEGYYKESGCTNKVAAPDGALLANTSYTNSSSEWTSTSPQTLYAKWTINQYTLTIVYEYADHTTASETYTADVNYGDSYSVNSPTISCYTPNQATVSGTMPANDVTVTVTYNIINYTVTATLNEGGTVSGGGTYNCGASCTLTANANTGYQFVNWTASDGSVVSANASYTFTVTGDVTYRANFTKTTVTSLPWTENFEGYSCGSGTWEYLHGEWATPLRWTKAACVSNYSAAATSGNYSLEMRASNSDNMVVLPQFDQPLNKLKIKFQIGRGNASSGYTVKLGYVTNPSDASTFHELSTINTPSNPVASHTQYTCDLTDNNNAPSSSEYRLAIKYTMTGEDSWYLDDFDVRCVYKIEVSDNPSGVASSLSGDGKYDHGATCTVTATAGDCYNFVNWTENGTEVSTSASYSFTATADRNLVANFTEWTLNLENNLTSLECINTGTEVVLTATATSDAAPTYTWDIASGSSEGTAINGIYTVSPTALSNTYMVSATVGSCVVTASNTVTVKPIINSVSSSEGDEVCFGLTTELSATSTDANATYSWNSGAGTGSPWTTPAITATTNFTVVATGLNSCTAESTKSIGMKTPGNQPMTHVEHGAIWTGYEGTDWSDEGNWVYFDGHYRALEGLSDTLNLILRTGDSDKCILNNPVINSPSFASNSGMIVRRPITIGEGTALNIDGDLNVESGSITLSSTGALLVTGNANIASGASVAFDNKDTLSIAGNLVLEGTLDFPESDTTPALRLGGNLVIDGGSLDEGGTLVFAGSSTQNVSNGASTLTLNNNVRMNMHRSRAGVPHTVFPDGTIFSKTTIFEYGIMDGNVTFDGTGRAIVYGDYESYASGIVTKLGAGNNFTFPTGDDNVLGTITAKIRTGQSAVAKFHHKATGFTIEDGYPRWWNVADMCGADPFNHVSNFEYWDFNSTEALSGVMFRTKSATPEEHFHDPSEYPDPDNPDNLIQIAVYDRCWQNTGGELSITPDFTDITISGVGVAARGTRSGAITTIGSKSKSVVLPIELLSFTATCNGKYAELAWSTASERNNDYFVIERSADAIEFTEVGRVAGAGNSIEQLDYTYNDYSIHGGDNYYRLVQVDYDGTRTVSDIVVANCADAVAGDPEVLAYPNPFSGELTLVMDNFDNRAATIEVYDMLGKLIYTEKASAPQNSYETILNLSNLPPATYTVRVSTTDFVINKNVVKN